MLLSSSAPVSVAAAEGVQCVDKKGRAGGGQAVNYRGVSLS